MLPGGMGRGLLSVLLQLYIFSLNALMGRAIADE